MLLDLTDGVATITLNRPDAMNSLDVATKEALLETVRPVAEDPEARCVVLTGTGRAFCVGQDLKEHIEILQSASSESLFRTVDEHYNPIVTALATMAKPVVAAVNGVAAGAGASLAFACDLRIAGRHRRLQPRLRQRRALLRHRRQLPPAAAGRPGQGDRAALLPAHDLGRRTPCAGARHAGRARRRAEPRPSASSPPGWPPARRWRYGAMRQSVAYAAGHSFEEALEFESAMMQQTGATEDHQAAVAAFVAKEKPVFEGR